MTLHRYTLSNGLTGVHLDDPAATAVSIHLWYRVGSCVEPEGKRGIAHFMEHMMFKGTPTVAPEEHARIIQRWGGEANAFTTEEVTAFTQTLPARFAMEVLEMEADRMENLLLPEEHFNREKQVILEEYAERVLNQPIARVLQRTRRMLFASHPYAIDPAGIPEDIHSITREDLFAFYNRYYHPANAILVTAGPVEGRAMEEMAEKSFGRVTKEGETTPSPQPFPATPPPAITDDSTMPLNLFARIYFLPHDPALYHRFTLLSIALGEGETALLRTGIERKRRNIIYSGAFYYPTWAGDLFFVYLGARFFTGLKGAVRRLDTLLHRPLPMNDEALDAIKGRVRIGTLTQRFGTEKKASRLGESAVLRNDPEAYFEDDRRFASMTLSDLQEGLTRLNETPGTDITLKARWLRRSS